MTLDRSKYNIQGVAASRAAISLGLLIMGYVLFFFYLAHLKYTYCTTHSADTAMFNHQFWSTLHGKFFYNFGLDMSWFGDKAGWLLVLVLPIYWLIPDPQTLLFVSTLLIGLSAIPMYMLAVDVLRDRTAAILATMAFLLFPTIVSQNVNQIQMMQFVIALVVLGLYFFCNERYLSFSACCATALILGTEDVGLTVCMFVPYALLRRRGMKWSLLVVLCVVVWYVLTFKVIMPAFRGDKPWSRALGYLSNLGGSPGEIIHTLLFNPQKTMSSLCTGENLFYLILLLQPLLWISPWCSWEIVFALPYLGLNLVSGNTAQKNIAWHYNVTVGMFLCVTTLFTIRKWAEAASRKWGPARYECGFALFYLSLAVVSWPLWLNIAEFRPRPYYQTQLAVLNLVPPESSVIAPESMIAHFSSRMQMHTVDGAAYLKQDITSYDYIILDANDRRYDPWITPEFVNKLATNPALELIFNQQNVLVFHRRGSP